MTVGAGNDAYVKAVASSGGSFGAVAQTRVTRSVGSDSAGDGIDITAGAISLDIEGLTLVAGSAVTALDSLPFHDDGVGPRRVLMQNIPISVFNNDAGYAAGFDTAGDGLVAAGSTLSVDYAGADSVVVAAGDGTGVGSLQTTDRILFADDSDGFNSKFAQISQLPFAASSHNHAASEITSGTLATNRGGTGVSSPTSGALLVGAGASAMTALSPGAAGGYVRSNGTTWVRSTISAGDLPTHSHAASDITSGQVAVARGGTGVASPTSGNLLVGAGTSAMTLLAPGAAAGYVRSNGSAWVRNSGVPAADVQAGTLAGAFTVNLAAGAVGSPAIRRSTDTDTGAWFPAANTMAWSAGGAERFRVTGVDSTHGQFRFQNGQVHTVEGAEITLGTAGSVTLDWDSYNSVDLRNDGNIDTINIDDGSMQAGNWYTLTVRYTTGGQASITFSATGTLQWLTGSAPTLPTDTVGDRTVVQFFKTGGITLGFYADAPA